MMLMFRRIWGDCQHRSGSRGVPAPGLPGRTQTHRRAGIAVDILQFKCQQFRKLKFNSIWSKLNDARSMSVGHQSLIARNNIQRSYTRTVQVHSLTITDEVGTSARETHHMWWGWGGGGSKRFSGYFLYLSSIVTILRWQNTTESLCLAPPSRPPLDSSFVRRKILTNLSWWLLQTLLQRAQHSIGQQYECNWKKNIQTWPGFCHPLMQKTF